MRSIAATPAFRCNKRRLPLSNMDITHVHTHTSTPHRLHNTNTTNPSTRIQTPSHSLPSALTSITHLYHSPPTPKSDTHSRSGPKHFTIINSSTCIPIPLRYSQRIRTQTYSPSQLHPTAFHSPSDTHLRLAPPTLTSNTHSRYGHAHSPSQLHSSAYSLADTSCNPTQRFS